MKKLEAVHRENPAIVAFPCDIASDQHQQRLVEHITRIYPGLNVLVNNAGIQHKYDFSDTRNHTDIIEEEVNINFLAHVKLTDRFLPILMGRPSAAVVNVNLCFGIDP